MEFFLYKKNIPVLIFEEDDEQNITQVTKVLNVEHLPVHLYTNAKPDASNLYGICEKLKDFLNNRMIPYNRKYFQSVLDDLEVDSAYSLAKKSHFLSLSDQYWILRKDEIGSLWWSDVNFFTNEYDSAIGLRLVNNSSDLNRNSNSHSPDNTTNGELPKRWVRKDGVNFLEKAGTGTEQLEPINEVLASEICKRLGINYIPYTYEIRDNQYYSLCPDIVDENHEMVPMESVYHDLHLEENQCYSFEKLITRCEELGIPNASEDLLKMLLLDFIIANEDRHTYNISFIRETESRKWIGVAPVYDSGKSMFLNKLSFEINMTSSFRIPSKPFADTQIKQFNLLPFEQLYGKIDLEKLSGIDKWYSKLLSKLVRVSDDKKATLVEVLMQRITEADSLLHKKYEESGVMFIKNGKKSSSQIVLEALQKNPHLTKEELETATNLSRATITRALSDLREQNKITRVGSNKTGYWQLFHFPN